MHCRCGTMSPGGQTRRHTQIVIWCRVESEHAHPSRNCVPRSIGFSFVGCLMSHFADAILKLLQRQDLSASEMRDCVGGIMDGQWADTEIAALLTALRMKGEAVAEIVGAAQAMQERALPVTSGRTGLLDTCGTGGDKLHTFNISTATALVAAAMGIPVAKHGNRSVSSSSGSADVLEALGVKVDVPVTTVTRCLDEIGIGFCFAPLMHGAMKHAAPIRRALGFPTIFNLLGPLTNPARAEYQLLGANRNATAEILAAAVAELKRSRALVVCGNNELDEVSLWGTTLAWEVCGESISRHEWSAETFHLDECSASDLRVESAQESAEVIRQILAAQPGPHRHVVIANAAAALLAIGRTKDPAEAATAAAAAIDSRAAESVLAKLVAMTNAK